MPNPEVNPNEQKQTKVEHKIEREGNVVNIYINFGAGGSAGGTGNPDNKGTGGTGNPDNKATGGAGEVDKS